MDQIYYYNAMKVSQLKELAKRNGMKGYSSMLKADLIKLLTGKDYLNQSSSRISHERYKSPFEPFDVIIQDSMPDLSMKGYIIQGIDISHISGVEYMEDYESEDGGIGGYYVPEYAWKPAHEFIYLQQYGRH